jgi:predicted nuclease of restriction endonuclease-like (RecB) superfamily
MTDRSTPAILDQKDYAAVHGDIVALLEAARRAAARSVNAVMTASYWAVGQRIVTFEQGGQERAAYGEALIERLSADLSALFGRGFSKQNLWQMRAFHLAWPARHIAQTLSAKSPVAPILQTLSGESSQAGTLQTVSGQSPDLSALAQAFPLPWSAYVRLLSVKNPQARAFYETETLRCGWSVRQLDRQVNSQFYERIALSRNKAAMLEKGRDCRTRRHPHARAGHQRPFRVGVPGSQGRIFRIRPGRRTDPASGRLSAGTGRRFRFVGRQRRLRLDDSWFRIDLLFFHRSLKCLLVIDLKVGQFSYADAGQMHMYLNYARQHWMKPGENPPIGLILCAGKGSNEAHYALEGLSNKVLTAEYRTALPDEKLLAEELEKTRRELEARRIAHGGDAEGGV